MKQGFGGFGMHEVYGFPRPHSGKDLLGGDGVVAVWDGEVTGVDSGVKGGDSGFLGPGRHSRYDFPRPHVTTGLSGSS